MSIAQHGSATFRTILYGQIKARIHLIIHEKLAMAALGTTVVGLKRVYLCYIQHGCHKGRANTATGANKVAAVQGVFNQLMGNVIKHGKAVAYDGI